MKYDALDQRSVKAVRNVWNDDVRWTTGQPHLSASTIHNRCQ